MSKQVKSIAGCNLPSGERVRLRRVDERVGPNLLSSQLELLRGETVLAVAPSEIKALLHQMQLPEDDEKWLLGHLDAEVNKNSITALRAVRR